jgi:hypothetical protein
VPPEPTGRPTRAGPEARSLSRASAHDAVTGTPRPGAALARPTGAASAGGTPAVQLHQPPLAPPRPAAAALTRPTSAHLSGRSSARQAGGCPQRSDQNWSEPMTSGNAAAAGRSPCRDAAPPHSSLPLLPQMSGASDRSRNQRFRRLKRSEWSGAGSNRRPSAFQGFCHPCNHDPVTIVLALLTRVHAGQ